MLTSAHDRSCKSCGQERVLTDSFPAFAKKVLQALEGVPKTDELKFAQDRNICFNGVLMNKAMLIAAHLFTEDKINEQAAATLLQIERAHGREVLTSSYTKIVRVVQICTKEAEGFSLPVHMLINFFLSYLSWALCYDVLSPKAITLETLDKGGAKDGNSGLVQTSLAKLALVTHLQLLVQDHKLANPKSTVVDELERLFKNFRDYESYASCFRRTRTLAATQGQAKGKGEHQDQKAVPQGQDEEEKAAAPKLALDTDEIIETMKRTLSKVGTACLDFLYDVFAGVHDGALKALATSAGGASAIKFADSGTSDFGTCLHELVRLIGSHKQVVSVDTEAPPPPASRALRRWASEECQEAGRSAELSRERENVWKQVQQIRRKVANVAVCAFSSEDELQRFFQKCGSAASFVGKPAEATCRQCEPVAQPRLVYCDDVVVALSHGCAAARARFRLACVAYFAVASSAVHVRSSSSCASCLRRLQWARRSIGSDRADRRASAVQRRGGSLIVSLSSAEAEERRASAELGRRGRGRDVHSRPIGSSFGAASSSPRPRPRHGRRGPCVPNICGQRWPSSSRSRGPATPTWSVTADPARCASRWRR